MSSSRQKQIRRSAAAEARPEVQGYKVEWTDQQEREGGRLFLAHERHRSWGWYYAKIRAGCSWVAIYERQGGNYTLLEASGSVGF